MTDNDDNFVSDMGKIKKNFQIYYKSIKKLHRP